MGFVEIFPRDAHPSKSAIDGCSDFVFVVHASACSLSNVTCVPSHLNDRITRDQDEIWSARIDEEERNGTNSNPHKLDPGYCTLEESA